jgi:hypothetical protein
MAEQSCTSAITFGRLKKAREFRQAAELVEESAAGREGLNAAYITLCVHAGIAAADVICCRRLAVHHQGDSHDGAVTMLGRVDRQLAGDLATLLRRKTVAGYSERASSEADRKQAKRAMERLVEAAESIAVGS